MVVSMSEGRVTRYKKDAKADMIRNNKTQIRCPCRTCKLQRWIDPDSGQLEDHLLRHGFMRDDFDEELAVNEGFRSIVNQFFSMDANGKAKI